MKRFLLPIFLLIFLFSIWKYDLLNNFISTYEDFQESDLSEELKFYDYVSTIDGDTIVIRGNDGKKITVRMIGIDAPEVSKTKKGYVECYGNEAKLYLKDLLRGVGKLGIEFDATQGKVDRYGRMLAYVFDNKTNLNKKILKDGYAFEYTFKNPYKYQKDFKNAEKVARENKYGLWGEMACNGERKK